MRRVEAAGTAAPSALAAPLDWLSGCRYNQRQVMHMTIQQILREKGLSRYQLSKRSGIPWATLADICSGKTALTRCSAGTLGKLSAALDIPMDLLPEPKSNSEVYGHLASGLPGLEDLAGIPVCGSAGDQQSALFGQACFTPGQAKNTYGTGCFTLMNVGDTPVRSRSGLVTSVGWQVAGKTVYALEGSVFNAGSTIQWLRDELGLIQSAPECDRLAESVPDSGGVVVVPAFTGLGAPYWDMYARGTIVGLTRGSTKAHIARAVLECIAYQTADLVRVMNADAPCPLTELRVDGGASVSDILMQIQADLLRLPVDRPAQVETTAFGAAALAGLAVGVWNGFDELAALRRSQCVFRPQREEEACLADLARWHRAVERSRSWIENNV